MIPQQNSQPIGFQTPQPQTIIEEPKKSFGCGCKSCAYMILILTILTAVIVVFLLLTVKLWFPPLFQSMFPESDNPLIYAESKEKKIVKYYDTSEWTKIDFDLGSFLVPFKGEPVKEHIAEFNADSYTFEQGTVMIQPNDVQNPNLRMKQLCTLNFKDFDQAQNLPEHISIALVLLAKFGSLSADPAYTPSYYESDDFFACQTGFVYTEEDGITVSLLVIPETMDPEEPNYTFIHIQSKDIDEYEFETVISTIEIEL